MSTDKFYNISNNIANDLKTETKMHKSTTQIEKLGRRGLSLDGGPGLVDAGCKRADIQKMTPADVFQNMRS